MKKNLNIAYLNGAEGLHRRFLCQSNVPSEPAITYEFVDLGLSVNWATCNVGATKPEEYGLYFAWGETQGYEGITDDKKFDWPDYKLCGSSSSKLTKYNNDSSYGTVDTLTILEQVDDAAYQDANGCRMPTKNEMQELIDNTTSTWEMLNGVNGRRFASKTNNNSIFVPAAGTCRYDSVAKVGSHGHLWSSSLSDSSPMYGFGLEFSSGYMDVYNDFDRCIGFPVRAVQNK